MIDKHTIQKIMRLSGLQLNNEHHETWVTDDLKRILGWVAQLQTVETKGVEPMVSSVESFTELRADISHHAPEKKIESLLKGAPDSRYGYFVVTKVVE